MQRRKPFQRGRDTADKLMMDLPASPYSDAVTELAGQMDFRDKQVAPAPGARRPPRPILRARRLLRGRRSPHPGEPRHARSSSCYPDHLTAGCVGDRGHGVLQSGSLTSRIDPGLILDSSWIDQDFGRSRILIGG